MFGGPSGQQSGMQYAPGVPPRGPGPGQLGSPRQPPPFAHAPGAPITSRPPLPQGPPGGPQSFMGGGAGGPPPFSRPPPPGPFENFPPRPGSEFNNRGPSRAGEGDFVGAPRPPLSSPPGQPGWGAPLPRQAAVTSSSMQPVLGRGAAPQPWSVQGGPVPQQGYSSTGWQVPSLGASRPPGQLPLQPNGPPPSQQLPGGQQRPPPPPYPPFALQPNRPPHFNAPGQLRPHSDTPYAHIQQQPPGLAGSSAQQQSLGWPQAVPNQPPFSSAPVHITRPTGLSQFPPNSSGQALPAGASVQGPNKQLQQAPLQSSNWTAVNGNQQVVGQSGLGNSFERAVGQAVQQQQQQEQPLFAPPSQQGWEAKPVPVGLPLRAEQQTGNNRTAQQNESQSASNGSDPSQDAWTAHKTGAGLVYYYNTVTGISTYEKPMFFKGEPAKVTTQPVPVAWEKLEDSDWALVTTDDGKKYYYNTITQATMWQVPPQVAELRAKKGAAGDSAEMPPSPVAETVQEAGKGPDAVQAGASALTLVKKKLTDSTEGAAAGVEGSLEAGIVTVATELVEGVFVANGHVASEQEEVDNEDEEAKEAAAKEAAEQAEKKRIKEQQASKFREMLKEKGVAPFSKWDRELPKIIFDPRFKAVPSHGERRSLFEHYVKNRAEEERKERRAAQKAAVDKFKALLEEKADELDHETTIDTFAEQFGEDPRFQALEQKERLVLLNERLAPLKKAHEEAAKAAEQQTVEAFTRMLESAHVTTNSRWSKVKETLRDDKRYSAVARDKREELFNSYVSKLRAKQEEEAKAGKAKKEEEERVRAREREVRKRKEREEEELERIRTKAKRKGAVSAFQALLLERVKEPDASWSEWRSKLEKDAEGRGVVPELEAADREKLFRDHLVQLKEAAARDYKALLVEVVTAEAAAKEEKKGHRILTSFGDAKRLLRDDPRYDRVSRSGRETLYRRFAEDLQQKLTGTEASKEVPEDGEVVKDDEKAEKKPDDDGKGWHDSKRDDKEKSKADTGDKKLEKSGSRKRDRERSESGERKQAKSKAPDRSQRDRSREKGRERGRSQERNSKRHDKDLEGRSSERRRSAERHHSKERHRSRSRHGHRKSRR